MKIDTLLRHLREAYRGVRRNTWMSFAAISAVAVTLFIFGIFLIVAFNIRFMTSELDKQIAIRASINPQLTDQQQGELKKQIEALPLVKEVELIPKEKGLRMMKESWGEGAEEVFSGLEGGENPFPDLIAVQPKDPQQTKKLTEEIKKFHPQIERVEDGGGVTDRLLNFSGWVGHIVLGFGIGLAILAAFLISNTIKLTIIARKREIEIQRLVGASNWFIRWPFFIEGAFIGIVGAVIPTICVLLLYQGLLSAMGAGEEAFTIIKLMPMLSLGLYVTICIFALGALIGIWGSVMSVRRFLKV